MDPGIKVKAEGDWASNHSWPDFPVRNYIPKPKPVQVKKKKGKWEPEEDELLKTYAQLYNEKDWVKVSEMIPGRSPEQCADHWRKVLKPGIKKGQLSPEEDKKIIEWVRRNGPNNWHECAKLLKGRTSKQCRSRWVNGLDPNLKRGEWTKEEDTLLFQLVKDFGTSWVYLAKQLPGRGEDSIKRRYYRWMRRGGYDENYSYPTVNRKKETGIERKKQGKSTTPGSRRKKDYWTEEEGEEGEMEEEEEDEDSEYDSILRGIKKEALDEKEEFEHYSIGMIEKDLLFKNEIFLPRVYRRMPSRKETPVTKGSLESEYSIGKIEDDFLSRYSDYSPTLKRENDESDNYTIGKIEEGLLLAGVLGEEIPIYGRNSTHKEKLVKNESLMVKVSNGKIEEDFQGKRSPPVKKENNEFDNYPIGRIKEEFVQTGENQGKKSLGRIKKEMSIENPILIPVNKREGSRASNRSHKSERIKQEEKGEKASNGSGLSSRIRDLAEIEEQLEELNKSMDNKLKTLNMSIFLSIINSPENSNVIPPFNEPKQEEQPRDMMKIENNPEDKKLEQNLENRNIKENPSNMDIEPKVERNIIEPEVERNIDNNTGGMNIEHKIEEPNLQTKPKSEFKVSYQSLAPNFKALSPQSQLLQVAAPSPSNSKPSTPQAKHPKSGSRIETELQPASIEHNFNLASPQMEAFKVPTPKETNSKPDIPQRKKMYNPNLNNSRLSSPKLNHQQAPNFPLESAFPEESKFHSPHVDNNERDFFGQSPSMLDSQIDNPETDPLGIFNFPLGTPNLSFPSLGELHGEFLSNYTTSPLSQLWEGLELENFVPTESFDVKEEDGVCIDIFDAPEKLRLECLSKKPNGIERVNNLITILKAFMGYDTETQALLRRKEKVRELLINMKKAIAAGFTVNYTYSKYLLNVVKRTPAGDKELERKMDYLFTKLTSLETLLVSVREKVDKIDADFNEYLRDEVKVEEFTDLLNHTTTEIVPKEVINVRFGALNSGFEQISKKWIVG